MPFYPVRWILRLLRRSFLLRGRVEALQREFDPEWYRETYLHGHRGISAFGHYLTHGVKQGHSPNPDFDEAFYRAHYPDVRTAIEGGRLLTGFDHYLRHGKHEGRMPRPVLRSEWLVGWRHLKPFFDSGWYARNYGVERRDAFEHYLEHCAKLHHNPNASFDEEFYLGFYEDARKAVEEGRFLCGFEHYLVIGRIEGRIVKHDVEKTVGVRLPYLLQPIGLEKAPMIAARIRPLPAVPRDESSATVWFLFPQFNPDIFFGGYRAALELAAAFSGAGHQVNFIICDEPNLNEDYAETLYRKHPIGELLRTVTILNRAKITHPIAIGRGDMVVAYSAWDAYLAHQLAQFTSIKHFAFLVQEHEAIFFDHSAEHAIVAHAYNLPHFPIFNSRLLQEFFAINRIGIFRADASPQRGVDYAVFEHPLLQLPPLHREAMCMRRVKKLVLYARPESHAQRNLFPLAWLALERAIDEGLFTDHWTFEGIGALKEYNLQIAGKRVIRLHKKFDELAYQKFLPTVDVGISLMYAPHPGLVAYEMAQAGARVVTNVFANRTAEFLRGISENLIPCEASIESIYAGIKEALRGIDNVESRIRGAKLNLPGPVPLNWDTTFGEKFFANELRGFVRSTDARQIVGVTRAKV